MTCENCYMAVSFTMTVRVDKPRRQYYPPWVEEQWCLQCVREYSS